MPAPVIDECRLPEKISEGAVGGFQFSTVVVVSATGKEQRNAQWSVPRAQWEIAYQQRTTVEGDELVRFFAARQGQLRGFRFKDWADYQATNEPLVVTGSKFVQLSKAYTSCAITYRRTIYKPTASPAATLRRNASSFTAFTLDTTTGLITLTTPDETRSITNITKAAQAVITTSVAHTLLTGQYVYIEGVSGMTQINGLVGVIQSVTSNTLTVNIDSTNFSNYASGGTVAKYVQPSEVLDWTGEFDVPVRFGTDQLQLVQDYVTVRSWQGIPIVELR